MKLTLTKTAVSTLALLASLASAQQSGTSASPSQAPEARVGSTRPAEAAAASSGSGAETPAAGAALVSEPPGTPPTRASETSANPSKLLAEPPASDASSTGSGNAGERAKAEGSGNTMPGVWGPGVVGPGMGPGLLGADPPEPRAGRSGEREDGERGSARSGSEGSEGMRGGKERQRARDARMKGDAMGSHARNHRDMGEYGRGQYGMYHHGMAPQEMHRYGPPRYCMHPHGMAHPGMAGHGMQPYGFHPHSMQCTPSQGMPPHAMPGHGMPGFDMGGQGMGQGMGAGRFAGRGPAPDMGPAGLERLISVLELDDKQVDQLETIQDELRKKHWEIAGRMLDEKAALRRAWRQRGEQRDREAIRGADRRLGELHIQSLESKFDAADRIEKVLDEEQRRKLRQFGPRWMTALMDDGE